MNFNWDEEHKLIQDTAIEFARTHLAPFSAQWDAESFFPVEVLKQLAQLGMAGMVCSSEIGGSELTRLQAALVFEALAEGDIGTSAYLSIHNMVTSVIDRYAHDSLRKTWGPQLTSMQALASYCLTEPDSGSDAAALKTKAVRQGDDYIINGSKAFISGAGVSDVYLCMVRTGDKSHKGISAILIEKNTKGLTFGEPEKKMGWKCQPTAMVHFENCRVPVSNLIHEEGQGFNIALHALNGGRINIAACSLGGARACLKATQTYMHERHQFNKPIKDFQALRFKYADMLAAYESARLLMYKAAQASDQNDSQAPYYCAMAKRVASDVGFDIANQCMQVFGGYGYLKDYPIERIFRDLRVHQILEGTNEIMREIIAKNALDDAHFFQKLEA